MEKTLVLTNFCAVKKKKKSNVIFSKYLESKVLSTLKGRFEERVCSSSRQNEENAVLTT